MKRTEKPIAGTHALTIGGNETAPIPYNASKRAVAAELEKLKRKRAKP